MLSKREEEVMECIEDYMIEFGFAPSVRDIASRMYVSHKTAHRYLMQLESKGRIKRLQHRPRAIQLI
ncbi:LexA family transcriptional regulator [Bacillus paranthracis]|uniref:LexA family transcriptional regulator n=2 Tax=root TaxID=1 RepID=A0A8E8PC28_9VIRU|nr:FaeA/PapI family transcriptional regulator [Bacillus paranthracis]YP_010771346.1 LexA family transcriptional regulator [Bacillus phage Sato]QPA48017.1 LexA family transcriptional regulator [Bacillus cereus]KAA8472184.1 LexA family transcriptional regulator [Bacillus paranthracis]QPA42343.1 LexA family transcriptional regulator [Bacillus paranthracis]QWE49628.1 LexA family transcriptional regulator [Bacillus phage Sato]